MTSASPDVAYTGPSCSISASPAARSRAARTARRQRTNKQISTMSSAATAAVNTATAAMWLVGTTSIPNGANAYSALSCRFESSDLSLSAPCSPPFPAPPASLPDRRALFSAQISRISAISSKTMRTMSRMISHNSESTFSVTVQVKTTPSEKSSPSSAAHA